MGHIFSILRKATHRVFEKQSPVFQQNVLPDVVLTNRMSKLGTKFWSKKKKSEVNIDQFL